MQSDDAISIGRAIVEALASLTDATSVSRGTRLVTLRPASGSDELLYTATTDTLLGVLYVANTDAASMDLRLHHVAAGGSVSQANALYYDLTVASGETLAVFEHAPITLNTGDMLWVRASTGGTLTFNLYGIPSAV